MGPRNRFQGMNSVAYVAWRARARICKLLRRPGIYSEDSIPPAYVAWRAGTTNRVIVPARQAENRFLGSLKGLQIRARYDNPIPPRFLDHIGCLKIPALNPHYESGFKSVFLVIFKAKSFIAGTLLKRKRNGEGLGVHKISQYNKHYSNLYKGGNLSSYMT